MSGVAQEKNHPESSLTFLATMRQYWLGKTKLKQAFRLIRNTFNKLLWI